MPNISTLNSLENRLLSEFSQGWKSNKYINRLVCPPIPVTQDQGRYLVNKNGQFIYDTARAPRTKAKQVDFDHTYGSWSVTEKALAMLMDKYELETAAEVGIEQLMNLKQDSVAYLMDLLELEREKAVADYLFGSAYYDNSWETDLGSGDEWNDYSTGDPIGDIQTGINKLRESGVYPNSLVMGRVSWNALRNHPDLINYFKVQMGMLNPEQIKSLFDGIQNLIIGDAVYNSGTEDVPVFTDIWGDNCAIVNIPSPQELRMGAKVHTAVFDKLKSYRSSEVDEGENIRLIQQVKYGLLNVSDKNGYLIKDTIQ